MAPIIIASLVSAGVSLFSSIFGARQANKRRAQAEKVLDEDKAELTSLKAQRSRELDSWRDRETKTNFLDRPDSMAAIRKVEQSNKEQLDALNTGAIRNGATSEAKVAAAGRLNRNLGDVISNISAAAAQHKDRVNLNWLTGKRDLDKYNMAGHQYDMLKVQNLMDNSGTENMLGGIGSAISTGLGAFAASSGGK